MQSTRTYIERFLEEMRQIIGSFDLEPINRTIECLYQMWQNEQTIFTMGNGGSASTATHFACDLSKVTVVEGKKRVRAICLNDNVPLASAWINDNGFDNLFAEQLYNLMRPRDVLIGISVHGGSGRDKAGLWSQNLLKAMHVARQHFGATTIGLSGFDGGAMRDLADICIVVPAYSTPQVESFHVALEHLISFGLRERIAQSP